MDCQGPLSSGTVQFSSIKVTSRLGSIFLRSNKHRYPYPEPSSWNSLLAPLTMLKIGFYPHASRPALWLPSLATSWSAVRPIECFSTDWKDGFQRFESGFDNLRDDVKGQGQVWRSLRLVDPSTARASTDNSRHTRNSACSFGLGIDCYQPIWGMLCLLWDRMNNGTRGRKRDGNREVLRKYQAFWRSLLELSASEITVAFTLTKPRRSGLIPRRCWSWRWWTCKELAYLIQTGEIHNQGTLKSLRYIKVFMQGQDR